MLFDGTAEKIDAHSYPATTEELVEAFGDHSMELPNGDETVGDALGRLGSETFEDPEDARLAVYTGVSDKAVGRVGYSDRDPIAPGERGPEPLSF